MRQPRHANSELKMLTFLSYGRLFSFNRIFHAKQRKWVISNLKLGHRRTWKTSFSPYTDVTVSISTFWRRRLLPQRQHLSVDFNAVSLIIYAMVSLYFWIIYNLCCHKKLFWKNTESKIQKLLLVKSSCWLQWLKNVSCLSSLILTFNDVNVMHVRDSSMVVRGIANDR